MKLFKTSEKIEVKNYPYGWKKTSMFFSLEWKKGKGFRSVRQTINPNTGKLNNPKKSTYNDVMILIQDEEGKAGYTVKEFYGDKGTIKTLHFIGKNYDLFTAEQIEGMAISALATLKASVYGQVNYKGAKPEDVLPLY